MKKSMPITWSATRSYLHETICTCDECESYRRNEAAYVRRMEERGEASDGVVITGMDREAHESSAR